MQNLLYFSRPPGFRVSFPKYEILFNNEIEIYLMWIDREAILNIMDRGTHYFVAKFQKNDFSEHM